MELFENSGFTRRLTDYLDEDEYRALQIELVNHPEEGDVMPGTGGFRKLRWVDTRRGKGRRGGLRIIYYYFAEDRQLWLAALYGKNEMTDLSPADKKALKAAVDRETATRAARKTPRS